MKFLFFVPLLALFNTSFLWASGCGENLVRARFNAHGFPLPDEINLEESIKRIEFLEITEDKVVYKNISNSELEITIKFYDRDDSLFGETANYVYYSKKMKIPPGVAFFSVCDDKAPNKKMVSIEGKDLYIEHKLN